MAILNFDEAKTTITKSDIETIVSSFKRASEINQDGTRLEKIQIVRMDYSNDLTVITFYDGLTQARTTLIGNAIGTPYGSSKSLNDAIDSAIQNIALRKCGYNKRLDYVEGIEEGIRDDFFKHPWLCAYVDSPVNK